MRGKSGYISINFHEIVKVDKVKHTTNLYKRVGIWALAKVVNSNGIQEEFYSSTCVSGMIIT